MDELFSQPEFSDFPASLHLAMLQDSVRMAAYKAAIAEAVKPGDVVVDIGSGTGILSFLALQAGAGSVHGLEISSLCGHAAEIAELNFPGQNIHFHQLDLLKDDLPDIQADVIICELFGNFGIEEDLLRILSRVRSTLLKPGGILLPETLDLYVVPVQCTPAYREIANWQTPVAGINFSACQVLAYNAVYQIHNEPLNVLSTPCEIAQLDLYNVAKLPTSLSTNFALSDGVLHGVAGWFRSRLTTGSTLDTGPEELDTHWGQIFFPTGDPISVSQGDEICFNFSETTCGSCVTWQWQGELRQVGEKDGRKYDFKSRRKLSG